MQLSDLPQAETDPTTQTLLEDQAGFIAQIRRLSKGKATGPDQLSSEAIKWAPETAHIMLHKYCLCLHKSSHTPQSWTASNTVLLHKKGDPTTLSNYRPISMANCLYKIWTGLLTRALTQYVETHNLLSSTQEGFRQGKSCPRQIRNLINAIEDAQLSTKNIYLLYIDLSAAFNTVDHNILLHILKIFGIPLDICHTLKSLYTTATTVILTPFGPTPPIPIKRGTLQGDTLSPLLFLLYIEILLRWLHQGGRGYRYSCLSHNDNAKYNLSAAAYADDLVAPTSSKTDLQIQANKIEAFCKWARLEVNVQKCAATAGLFQSWRAEGTSIIHTAKKDLRPQHQLATLLIQGQQVPYLPPHGSFPYLGIPINLMLDWKPAFQLLIHKIKLKGQALLRNKTLTPQQKLKIVDETITSMAAYMLNIAPFTIAQMDLLEGSIARIKRQVLGLPDYFPTVALSSTPEEGGWGRGPLTHDLIQSTIRNYTICLNDSGRLGKVTHALMNKQVKHWQAHPRLHIPDLGPIGASSTGLRQMHILSQAGITHIKESDPATSCIPHTIPSPPPLLTILQDLFSEQLPPTLLNCLQSLWEAGITNLTQILCPAGNQAPTLLSTTDLTNLLGSHFTRKHKQALNKLTWYLHSNTTQPPPQLATDQSPH